MHCTFARSFNEHPNSLSLRSLICNTFIEGHPNFCRTSFFVVGMTYSLFYRYNSSCTVFWVSSFHLSVMHLSMLCRRGGRAWGRDLNVFVGPGVGHLTDLVLPGEGIFESFFARRGDIWLPTRMKKTETEHMFPASTLHACAVRSGKIWKSWRPTGTSESWVDFTVLSSNFVCFSVFLINWTS